MPKIPAFPEEIYVAIEESDGDLYAFRDEHSALGDYMEEDVVAVYRLVEVNKIAVERIVSRTAVRKAGGRYTVPKAGTGKA